MTADELISKLPILSENIAEETVRQPILFVDAARYRVAMMRLRARADAMLRAAQAGLAVKIRSRRNKIGEKITEGGLKERLELDKNIKQLREALDRAYEREELAKLILEGCRERMSSLKLVGEMQIAEGRNESAAIERNEQRKKMVSTVRKLYDKSSATKGR